MREKVSIDCVKIYLNRLKVVDVFLSQWLPCPLPIWSEMPSKTILLNLIFAASCQIMQ